jgi:hypothetical protein
MFTEIKQKIIKWRYLDFFILAVLCLLGLLLRAYLINQNLFFGPEQGRDMLVVKDIVINHKLVLIGPRTAVDGIFHGPLYYYLATIPFLISKGSPLVIALFFILLNSLAIFPLFLLGKELFNKRVGLIASVLFTFSFGAIVMSRWLSHPPLIIPISCLFFLFLVKFLKGKNIHLLPVAVCFGLASQAEFTDFLIFSVILFLTLVVFWKRFLKQKFIFLAVSSLVLLVGTFANFLLFDLRHQFLITNSFIKLLTKHTGFYGTLANSFSGSIDSFIHIAYDSLTPFYPIAVILVVIFALVGLVTQIKKNRIGVSIVLIWLFSPFVAFVVLKYDPLYHYFAAVIIALIILSAFLIDKVYTFRKPLGLSLILLFVLINLFALFNNLPGNKNVFFESTQPDLKYSDQVAVINKIYQQANGKLFSFQSYTIPYWLQEEWQYLFWYRGQSFGYTPSENAKILFVIIQNDPNNQLYQNNWLKKTVATWGTKETEFRQGALRVQTLQVRQ